MNYNFSSTAELNSCIRKMELSVSRLESEYKSISSIKDLESKITSSYLLLDRCYMGIQEVKLFQSFLKGARMNLLSSVKKSHNQILSKLLSSLEEISEEVKPESYTKDLEKISKLINEVPLRTSIFPKEDAIIIYSIFPKDKNYLIFSTLYTENNSEKFLSVSNTDRILPGKYLMGDKVEDIEEFFKPRNLLLSNVLKEANVLPKNKVRAKVKEGVNLMKAKSLLCNTLQSYIKEAILLDDNIIVSFNKLRDNEVKLVANTLKLSSNDKYLMLSMQGE